MRIVSLSTLVLTAFVLGSASTAHASWLVYVQADAGARSDSIAMDSSTECSGTLASTDYCGADARIIPNQAQLNTSADATAYPNPNYNSGYGYQHGDGSASADLATGKLRIVDHAVSDGVTSEQTYGGADASIQDELHFHSADNSPFAITVRLHVDGLFEGYQQPRFSIGLAMV